MNALINVPNLLSAFRLVSPLAIICTNNFWLSFCIFIAAALSDFFDGYIARRFNQKSEFGALLDPVADKVFVMSLYIYFMLCGVINWGVTAIVIIRDILIMCGVLFLKANNIRVVATPIWESKINTALQFALLFMAYISLACSYLNVVVSLLSIAVVISTIYSGYLYYKIFLEYIDKKS